jgi:hypothetical protein
VAKPTCRHPPVVHPRHLFGSSGAIARHSNSVRS